MLSRRGRFTPGRWAAIVGLGLVSSGVQPRPLPAQEADPTPPNQVDPIARADSIRVVLAATRPPNAHPVDFIDVVGFPFRVIGAPIHFVLVHVPSYVAGQVTLPRPPGFLVRTYRDLASVGIRPMLHTSIGPRSGLAAGVTYTPVAPLAIETAFSVHLSQRHRLTFHVPGDSALVARIGWQRDARASFYGIGPRSSTARTLYRRDRAHGAVRGALRPSRSLELAAETGFEDNLVDEPVGADDDDTARFDPVADSLPFGAEGRQRYLRFGLSGNVDLTRAGPFQSSGVRLSAGGTLFRGVDGTQSDFHVLSFEAQGLVPLNPRQLLALRGLTEIARGGSGEIPFYHLPTLGGERTGIGYPDGRFADRDMISLSAEWRYEVWRDIHNGVRLETFLHGGAGAVERRLTDVGGGDWQPSFGIGFRAARTDHLLGLLFLGFSDESVHFGVSGEWTP